jgi:Domain of unknown function (DUF4105)
MLTGQHNGRGDAADTPAYLDPTCCTGSALASEGHDGTKGVMARDIIRWAGTVLAGLVLLFAGLWAALAIWFRLAPTPPLREILAGGLLLLGLAAIVCLALRRWRVVALYGVCCAAVFGWWATLQPSNDRAWTDDVARTATGTVEGDRLVMRNVRNFVWRSDSDYEPRWETRSYDLNGLTGLDLFMSYWAGESIAHAIVSFGFADGQHLAFSIETRKEKTESYSALAGFFRAYELSFIAADERDVVGARTNVRGEDVRIYRLRIAPAQVRALLLEYVAETNELARTPQFYNSLTTNCTTEIFRMVRAVRPGLPLDYRMLLTGYVPDYIYDLGGMDRTIPFEVLRDRSHILGKAYSTDPDFSLKIRGAIGAQNGP